MGTSVVLVDDHEGFRRGACRLLTAAGFHVVGQAATAAGGIEVVRRLVPDAVLIDVLLPDGTGFDVARELDRSDPRPRIVLISSRRAADFGPRLVESRADGFIAKADLSAETLVEALTP